MGHSPNGRGMVGDSYYDDGIFGYSDRANGVKGSSNVGTGVLGVSLEGQGFHGESSAAAQPSVFGLKLTTGNAVWGRIAAPTSGWGGVYGSTNGTGPGVIGETTADGVGTWGRAFGTGPGIYGESSLGRGGQFTGKKAQIRLDPSTDATHPGSGLKGDFFVDTSGRLWFCKGGLHWKQLA